MSGGGGREKQVETAEQGERIAKRIARAGLASRRDAERMIAAGRVKLNGRLVETAATIVTPKDRIEVDGDPLAERERTRLWLFHKPKGLVTTNRDPEGRPTIFSVLPKDLPRVMTVGRLDIGTEGLLLLTNDGGLARVLELPSTGWLRRYRVRAHGAVEAAALDKLRRGVTIAGMVYGGIEAAIDRVQGTNVWLTLGLREGKNREVRRVLEHLGLSVNRLIRISYGPFQLGDLKPGDVEEVRGRVLRDQLGEKLSKAAHADFDAPIRLPKAEEPKPRPKRGKPHARRRRPV
jgi:23S rRNA pseudouridine2605 synthase